MEAVFVDVDAEAGWYATAGLDDPAVQRPAVHALAAGVIERVATTVTPQPVLAVVERRVAPATLLGDPGTSFVIVVDRFADPGNAGTVLRSAEAAGADAVVCTPGTVDLFNPKVVRASAGALFHVPVVVDLPLDAFPRSGWRVFGTTSHLGSDGVPPTPYDEVDLDGRIAFVLGNEAHGLAPDAAVDRWVTIPHAGRSESLNVAMAATVLAFDVARRRRAR